MKKIITLLFILLITITSNAQTKAEKTEAYNIAVEAIKLMDDGKINKSIKMLEKSKKLDPTNYLYPYEIAYAQFLNKDHKKAIKTLKEVLKYNKTSDQCYTLLGNIYDIDGDSKKAIDTYNKGLEKHPNSGRLYFERGVVLQMLEKYDEALQSWEKGIEIEPKYPSNYFAASKLFCKYTSEKIWGLIYGEIFINLERGSERTAELSKLLFKTYNEAIVVESKNKLNVSFAKQMQMNLPKEGEELKLPFSMPYEVNMSIAATTVLLDKKIKTNEISLSQMSEIRLRFINNWFESDDAEKYPNVLFDWHKKTDRFRLF